jgi:hypothetical protein
MGLSPLATEQDSWTDSPALTGPSPKENGNILGNTKNNYQQRPNTHSCINI